MKGWLEKGQMFETSPKVEQVRYIGKIRQDHWQDPPGSLARSAGIIGKIL